MSRHHAVHLVGEVRRKSVKSISRGKLEEASLIMIRQLQAAWHWRSHHFDIRKQNDREDQWRVHDQIAIFGWLTVMFFSRAVMVGWCARSRWSLIMIMSWVADAKLYMLSSMSRRERIDVEIEILCSTSWPLANQRSLINQQVDRDNELTRSSLQLVGVDGARWVFHSNSFDCKTNKFMMLQEIQCHRHEA